MDKLTQWIALTVVACLAVLAAGWFLLVSPKRAEAADLRQQTSDMDASNTSAQAKLVVLKAQAKDLPKKQAELAKVAAQIPDNPGLPALVRALTAASTSSGVELVSVTPGAPALVEAPVPPAAPVPEASPAADGTVTAPVPAPEPASDAAGALANVPVQVNVVGDYFEVEQFLSELEGLSRALRVTTVALTPGKSPLEQGGDAASTEDGRSLTAVISGFVYMAGGRVPAQPVIVPGQQSSPAAAAPGALPADGSLPANGTPPSPLPSPAAN